MTSPSPLSLHLCLSNTRPDHSNLLDRARDLLYEHGSVAVLDELSRPHTLHPPELLPYLSSMLLDASESPVSFTPVSASSTCTHLRTRCKSIDALLQGGIPLVSGSLFELSGTAGAGKTQLALQLCLAAVLPLSKGGLGGSATYLCTEGPPPVRRLISLDEALCKRERLNKGSLIKRVAIERASGDADGLLHWAKHRLPRLRREGDVRLAVVDSVAAVYRVDFDDVRVRARHLAQLGAALRASDVTVVVVNQVSQAMDRLSGELDAVVPALGGAWTACVDTRLFLARRGGGARRSARVLSSSCVACDQPAAEWLVTEDGVVDEMVEMV